MASLRFSSKTKEAKTEFLRLYCNPREFALFYPPNFRASAGGGGGAEGRVGEQGFSATLNLLLSEKTARRQALTRSNSRPPRLPCPTNHRPSRSTLGPAANPRTRQPPITIAPHGIDRYRVQPHPR